jgi:cbb3-type cytochrome oxidase maturation protein
MEILLLLIPLSVTLVGFIAAALFWGVNTGQMEVTQQDGEKILQDPD